MHGGRVHAMSFTQTENLGGIYVLDCIWNLRVWKEMREYQTGLYFWDSEAPLKTCLLGMLGYSLKSELFVTKQAVHFS